MGTQPLGFAPLQPFGAYPWQAYVQPCDGHWPTPGIQRVPACSTILSKGEPHATTSAVPQPSQLYGWAYSFEAWHRVTQSSTFLHGGQGSSFPSLVPSNGMVNSEPVVSINVVILVW